MKQFSAVEILYLASELQKLIKARLSQIYQQGRKGLILQFYMTGKGRAMLKVRVPYACYVASEKEQSAAAGFCSLLRKKLNNSTLKALSQPGFERILQLDFSSKNSLFSLFLELFSKGNIILVHEGKILAVAEKQAWSTREMAAGRPYKLPPAVADPRAFSDEQLLQMLKSTNKTDLVRFFALELSLGGLYAEELCLLSGLNKKTAPATVTSASAQKILQSLKKLLNSKPFPLVIYENKAAIDAVPISLKYYENYEKKSFDSYSEALEDFFSATAAEMPSRYDSEISRLKAVIQHQEEAIAASKNLIEKNRRSGELIYENYQEIKQLLEAVNAARKQGGWEAVKQLQKDNRRIKFVDEKTGKITTDF